MDENALAILYNYISYLTLHVLAIYDCTSAGLT